MTRGFVTIATGNEKYYILAVNLLKSYQYFAKQKYPFAIICDRENEYTSLFDKVVILENPTNSYIDKLQLLNNCPYDENIFIDADCLAYADLNEYWSVFENADDFSCFGKALPLDSKEGLFNKEDAGRWKNDIHFVTHLHGVIYFIRKSEKCAELLDTCYEIIDEYKTLYFEGFKEPADESVLSLAMAIHNLKPVKRESKYYIFYPMKSYIKMNISKGFLSYSTEKETRENHGMLIHWANVNTKRADYIIESKKLEELIGKGTVNEIYFVMLKMKYRFKDFCIETTKKIYYLLGDTKSKIYRWKNNI